MVFWIHSNVKYNELQIQKQSQAKSEMVQAIDV
ncbi:hypothetical protein LFDSGCCC_CDS0023 [Phage C75C1]|nr:hypothetical protein LFDSGCCC_CDS0023 [Phage C75C1]